MTQLSTPREVGKRIGPTLNLDGRDVDCTEGETIYQVSKRHASQVPTLCFDERLEAFRTVRDRMRDRIRLFLLAASRDDLPTPEPATLG